MHGRLKNYALVICLFVFLFISIGNGLHLTPGAAFIGALSGTPLVIFAFNRWSDANVGERRRAERNPLPRSSHCASDHETSPASAATARS